MYQKPKLWARNVLFAALPLCLLTGCAGATAESDFQPVLDPAFTVQAEMEYADGQKAAVSASRGGDSVWDLTFTEPPALAGVVLSIDGDAVSASYKGLSFSVPKSAVGAKAMLLYLTDVLDTLAGTDPIPCTQSEDGTWETSGDCEGGGYTLTFSSDGKLHSFSLPAQPLTVTFTDYVCSSAAPAETTTGAASSAMPESTSVSAETTAPAS